MQQVRTYPVVGMTCATCALTVKKTLGRQEGVSRAEVNLSDNSATIAFDDALCMPQQLKNAVREIGYDLIVASEKPCTIEEREQQHLVRLKKRTIASFVLMIPMMCISMWCMKTAWAPWALWLLATPFVVVLGNTFFVNAFKQFMHRQLGMDALVAISTGTAYVFSTVNLLFPGVIGSDLWFESTAGIVSFILLGRWLEARAKHHTNAAVRALMQLPPEVAVKVENGEEKSTPLENIGIGDVIRTQESQRFATDGIVVGGEAWADESMLTGEAVWVKKVPGSKVLAGTTCVKGTADSRTERIGEDTELGCIIQLVRQAGKAAPMQQMAERVAGIFVPTVMLLSVAVLICWGWLMPEGTWSVALRHAITVLVIACPCSLGLATPTAVTVAIGKALQGGLLVKDAESFEATCKTDTILLDKTGTVTNGGFGGNFDHEQQTESVKAGSREAVEKLKEMGFDVWLLSGDAALRVKNVAEVTGIAHWRAETTPRDKYNMVYDLQNDGHAVCMIGDGVNDSAAMAAAQMSFAMGQGSNAAMQTAKAVLLHSDLRAICGFVQLSHRTVKTIRQNLFWAFFYNIVAIPLAAMGLVSPVTGAMCMAMSSVCVVTNSLFLHRFKWEHATALPVEADEKTVATTENISGQTINTTNMKPVYTYSIEGMMCQNCRKHVERALNAMPGIEKAAVVLETAQADIIFAEQPLKTSEIQHFLTEEAGDYTIKEKL